MLGQTARSQGAAEGLAARGRVRGAVKAGCPSFCPWGGQETPFLVIPSTSKESADGHGEDTGAA